MNKMPNLLRRVFKPPKTVHGRRPTSRERLAEKIWNEYLLQKIRVIEGSRKIPENKKPALIEKLKMQVSNSTDLHYMLKKISGRFTDKIAEKIAKRRLDRLKRYSVLSFFPLKHVAPVRLMRRTAYNATDLHTWQHKRRVKRLVLEIFNRLTLEQRKKLNTSKKEVKDSAEYHDELKLLVPSAIQRGAKPDKNEWELIKAHAEEAEKKLLEAGVNPRAAKVARQHHVRQFKGESYPELSQGEQRDELSKLLQVADGFDRMAAGAGYVSGIRNIASLKEKLEQERDILKERESDFTPAYYNALLNALEDRQFLKWWNKEMLKAGKKGKLDRRKNENNVQNERRQMNDMH